MIARPRLGHLPLRHLLQPDCGRRVLGRGTAAKGHRKGDRGREGVLHGGGRRALPDRNSMTRWRITCARSGPSTARRQAARGAAAGSTPWRWATRRGSTGSPASPSPSWTCSTGLRELKIATAYRIGDEVIRQVPDTYNMARVDPVYEDMGRLAGNHPPRPALD